MKALIAVPLIALAGCASSDFTREELELVRAQMEAKTLEIDCPTGCKIAYKDPRDTVSLPQKTNGWDAAIAVTQSVERIAGAAIVPAAMGYVAKEGFDALRGSGAVTTTTTTTTSTDTEIGDYSGRNAGSVGDYSGAQSGNAGELISGNSGAIDSPDSTHAPTDPVIVTQPAPVIAPSPVIVEQPSPVVVEQPRPIIVPVTP